MTISGEGVLLRPYRPEDADDVAVGCADPLTQRFVPNLAHPYTRADALRWITEEVPGRAASGDTVHAVVDPVTDRMLGGCGLFNRGEGTAEIGYWTMPDARGRGVATEVTRALTGFAFGRGIRRVYLRIEPENVPSQRVALACGYTREGVQRGAGAGPNGTRTDLIMWARLDTDPDGPSTRLLPDLPGDGPPALRRLTDGVIALVPLGPGDIDDSLAVRSLPESVASSVPPEPPRREDIERRCLRAQSGWLAGARADFTIREAATDAFAGEISLMYQEPPTRQAMIGYDIMPAFRRRGYATRAARLVAAWGFDHVGLARLVAGTEPGTVGSQRVLEGGGFVREGVERARLPAVGGGRIDNLAYALLPDTFPRTPDSRLSPIRLAPS
jgi:RimJ/RimL family protein N-acetyltransferase